MPKLSIGSWAFAFGPFAAEPWPFSKVLRYAKEAGYEGIEINGFFPHPVPEMYDTPAKRQQLLAEIEYSGLGVSAYAPDFSLAPPATAKNADYIELFKRYAEFARALGTDTIRVDTAVPPSELSEAEYGERFGRLTENWRKAAEIAAGSGMRIVWEFEPGFWLNKPSEVLHTVRSVGHPAFQVLFDTSHAYMSGVIGARQTGEKEILPGGIVAYAKLLEDHIGHFHLIDSDGTLHDEETSTHTHFGDGLIDFAVFLKEAGSALQKLEWWCVDYCFNAETEQWGKMAVTFVREKIGEARL